MAFNLNIRCCIINNLLTIHYKLFTYKFVSVYVFARKSMGRELCEF